MAGALGDRGGSRACGPGGGGGDVSEGDPGWQGERLTPHGKEFKDSHCFHLVCPGPSGAASKQRFC